MCAGLCLCVCLCFVACTVTLLIYMTFEGLFAAMLLQASSAGWKQRHMLKSVSKVLKYRVLLIFVLL